MGVSSSSNLYPPHILNRIFRKDLCEFMRNPLQRTYEITTRPTLCRYSCRIVRSSDKPPQDWFPSLSLGLSVGRCLSMSELSKALERISGVVQTGRSRLAQHLQGLHPGLSRADIESKICDFPFALPQEFYELYQWRNGGSLEISYLDRIYSLDEAIALYQNMCDSRQDFDPHLFPVVKLHEEGGIVVCLRGSDSPKESSPVLEWRAGGQEPGIWHGRFTDLMMAIADVLDMDCQKPSAIA